MELDPRIKHQVINNMCMLWQRYLAQLDDPDITDDFLKQYTSAIIDNRASMITNRQEMVSANPYSFHTMEQIYFHADITILLEMISHCSSHRISLRRKFQLTLYNTFRTMTNPIAHSILSTLDGVLRQR